MQFALNSETITLSQLDANSALQSIESKCRLSVINGTMRPTIEFLRCVADYLRSIGLANATPAAAWQFWYAIGIYEQLAKKNTEEFSKIAYWYKLDPFNLSEVQQVGLLANLDRMQCQEKIFRADYNPMDYNGIYTLFKVAYDDEDLARKKQTEAFKLYVEKCTQNRR